MRTLGPPACGPPILTLPRGWRLARRVLRHVVIDVEVEGGAELRDQRPCAEPREALLHERREALTRAATRRLSETNPITVEGCSVSSTGTGTYKACQCAAA